MLRSNRKPETVLTPSHIDKHTCRNDGVLQSRARYLYKLELEGGLKHDMALNAVVRRLRKNKEFVKNALRQPMT